MQPGELAQWGKYCEVKAGVCAHSWYPHEYNYLLYLLVYSVAQSVLEMTTVGSAFKVDPKPQQLSPSQYKVKAL